MDRTETARWCCDSNMRAAILLEMMVLSMQ